MLRDRSNSWHVRATWAALLVIAAIVSGCGSSEPVLPAATPPTVGTPSSLLTQPASAIQPTDRDVASIEEITIPAVEATQPATDKPAAYPEITAAPSLPVASAKRPPAAKSRTADPNLLLPDLRTLAPHSLRVREDRRTGRRLLRLGNTYWNAGKGMLELRGDHDLDKVTTLVTQRIQTRQGQLKRVRVGNFEFHPKHNHWHFGSLAVYEVLQLRSDGSLGPVVASSGKLTYCLLDTNRVAPDLEGAPRKEKYLKCGRRLQGLSVGWGDTYGFRLPDQHVDITGIPDGRYALRSTADPGDLIWETNERNNAGVTYIKLRGKRVDVLPAP